VKPVALAVLGPLVLGCFLTTEPADRVNLEVTVNPVSFTSGDTARVRVMLANRGSDPVEFEAHGCPVYFAVFDEDGREVVPSSLGCPLVPVTISLAGGEERRYEFTWLGEPWTNGRPHGRPYPTEFLPSGRYQVRGVLALESRRRFSSPVEVEISSPN
jgi:hypothetical protein